MGLATIPSTFRLARSQRPGSSRKRGVEPSGDPSSRDRRNARSARRHAGYHHAFQAVKDGEHGGRPEARRASLLGREAPARSVPLGLPRDRQGSRPLGQNRRRSSARPSGARASPDLVKHEEKNRAGAEAVMRAMSGIGSSGVAAAGVDSSRFTATPFPAGDFRGSLDPPASHELGNLSALASSA